MNTGTVEKNFLKQVDRALFVSVCVIAVSHPGGGVFVVFSVARKHYTYLTSFFLSPFSDSGF